MPNVILLLQSLLCYIAIHGVSGSDSSHAFCLTLGVFWSTDRHVFRYLNGSSLPHMYTNTFKIYRVTWYTNDIQRYEKDGRNHQADSSCGWAVSAWSSLWGRFHQRLGCAGECHCNQRWSEYHQKYMLEERYISWYPSHYLCADCVVTFFLAIHCAWSKSRIHSLIVSETPCHHIGYTNPMKLPY